MDQCLDTKIIEVREIPKQRGMHGMAKNVDIVIDILIYYSMSENARHS